MMELQDPTGWSAMLLGLFTFFAGFGAMRKPGVWRTLVTEVEESPALQLLSGGLEMFVGVALYAVNPWIDVDMLGGIMKILGALMIIEALTVLAISDLYFQFWLRSLAHFQRGWPALTVLFGLALVTAGTFRFH